MGRNKFQCSHRAILPESPELLYSSSLRQWAHLGLIWKLLLELTWTTKILKHSIKKKQEKQETHKT